MEWWNQFVDWLGSPAGSRILTSAVIPFVAIIVAALLAAWIGRGFARRVVDHQQNELKAAAIMSLIGAGRKAAIWNTLGVDERQHVDSLISEADIRVRLLAVNGAAAAADWGHHELISMKTNSATFSFQADQTFVDFRDRLLEWQNKPQRARKLFAYDLERWRLDDDATEATVANGSAVESNWTPNSVPSAPVTPPAVASTGSAGAAVAPVATSLPATGPVPTAVTPVTDAEALASAPPPTRGTAMPVATAPRATSTFAPRSEPLERVEPPEVGSDTAQIVYKRDTDDTFDENVDDAESNDAYSPPVTAGTVRERIAPHSDNE